MSYRKVLTCESPGTIGIQSSQSYGQWEFDVYKGGDGNSLGPISFISTTADKSTNDGYNISINSSEEVYLQSRVGGTPTTLCNTAGSYVENNTWYRIKVTRTLTGVFTVYIRGGAFGDDDWTLVDVTGGSGTNPVTSNTHTSSKYMVIDLDAGDRITNILFKKGVMV